MKTQLKKETRNLISIHLVLLLFLSSQLIVAQTNTANLANKVRDAIQNEYLSNIYVSADNNGKVILTGDVNSLFDKLRIYDLAAKVKGVKEISDQLELPDIIVPDDIIQSNIEESLGVNHQIVEPDKINVTVNNGIVFLKGKISYPDEKTVAETVASWEKGVKGIENELIVDNLKYAKSDKNIESVVNEIIKNRYELGANTIHAVTNDGTVVLKGYAANKFEEFNLPNSIDKLPGVKNVVDKLELKTTT